MKKIMGMMLGMSLLMGTVALFADAPPKKEPTTTTKTKKTKKGKRTVNADGTTPPAKKI
jgi:hypothetical protein